MPIVGLTSMPIHTEGNSALMPKGGSKTLPVLQKVGTNWGQNDVITNYANKGFTGNNP
jgi:hypothetical protein